MNVLSHRPLLCQLLIFQLYTQPKLFKDVYKSGPFLCTGLQTPSKSTWQFEGKFRTLCSVFEISVCLFVLFVLLDILHRPSGGYMNVVHISELIKLLCLGIWDLTSQSPFRKISLGINICLNVLRRHKSMQKLKLHQFKWISMDSDWVIFSLFCPL